VYLQGAYREKIDALVARLKKKHGFLEGRHEKDDGPPRQITLFAGLANRGGR